jgi:hypothetical protein
MSVKMYLNSFGYRVSHFESEPETRDSKHPGTFLLPTW